MSMVLSAQKRQTLRRPMPRRRGARGAERSRAMSGALPFTHLLDVAALLELCLLALGAPGRPQRGGRRVLGLTDRDEAEDRIHEGQGAFDLPQRLGRGPVLEQDVVGPALLGDEIGEVAQAPVLHLAHRPALLLDQLLNAGGQLLRAGLALLRVYQYERFIAAIRHALPPVG